MKRWEEDGEGVGKKLLQEEKSETPKPELWSGIFSAARGAQSLWPKVELEIGKEHNRESPATPKKREELKLSLCAQRLHIGREALAWEQ